MKQKKIGLSALAASALLLTGVVIGSSAAGSAGAQSAAGRPADRSGETAVPSYVSTPVSNHRQSPAGIKSASYSPAKVYFYGEEVPLKDALVLVTPEGGGPSKLYMPVRELLEYMNFNVTWSSEDSAVYLTMDGYNGGVDVDDPAALPQNEADRTALDIMQRTGNWGYIEPYLPSMSREGIDAVTASYNSKHMNPKEHKNAADYYN